MTLSVRGALNVSFLKGYRRSENGDRLNCDSAQLSHWLQLMGWLIWVLLVAVGWTSNIVTYATAGLIFSANQKHLRSGVLSLKLKSKTLQSFVQSWKSRIFSVFKVFDVQGFQEFLRGVSNYLKLIERYDYGVTNFEHFRLRCLIYWHFPVSAT